MEKNTIKKHFFKWLSDGINDGSMTINSSSSLVHFVDEGVFIKTPSIFRRFIKQNKDLNITHDDIARILIEKNLFNLNKKGLLVFSYYVEGNKKIVLHGYLFKLDLLTINKSQIINNLLLTKCSHQGL